MMKIINKTIPLRDGRLSKYHVINTFDVNMKTFEVTILVDSWVDVISPVVDSSRTYKVQLSDWNPDYALNLLGLLEQLPEWRDIPSTPYTEAQITSANNPPSGKHVWDEVNRVWLDKRSLEEVQADKWELIKEIRAHKELEPVMFEGYLYDSDVKRITGAVTSAMICQQLGQPYSVEWTTKTNELIPLTADQVIQLGLTLSMHVSNIFAIARAKRDYIFSRTTNEEVDKVTWDSIE